MFETQYREAFSQVTASADLRERVLNMKEKGNNRSQFGFIKVVLVVALVAVLAVSVGASETVASWFKNYFGFGKLTAEQNAYIEDNEQYIGQSQTVDGYTVTLKSAMTDGETVYMLIELSAPEDLPLQTAVFDGVQLPLTFLEFNKIQFVDSEGKTTIECISRTMYPGDKESNTQEVLFSFELSGNEDSLQWHMELEGLTGRYSNTAHMNEVEYNENAGQKSGQYKSEDFEKAYPAILLTDGSWEFDFCFEKSSQKEVELIKSPITTSVRVFKGDGTYDYEKITITSFKLASLSATVTFESPNGLAEFADNLHDQVCVVMKDGSQVVLLESSGDGKMKKFKAWSPIILEKADYILLSDGTQIPIG